MYAREMLLELFYGCWHFLFLVFAHLDAQEFLDVFLGQPCNHIDGGILILFDKSFTGSRLRLVEGFVRARNRFLPVSHRVGS